MFLFLFIPYYLTAVYPLPNAGCKKLYYSTNINDPVSKTVGEASLPEKPRLFDIILKCSNVPISIFRYCVNRRPLKKQKAKS
jgi:hypothetical protein